MSSTDAHPGCQAWNSCAGRAPTARNTSAATSRTARNTNEVPATAPSIATSTSAGRQRAARWNWNAEQQKVRATSTRCLLYTSDAADEEDSVDLGGRRIIKKKK